MKSPETNQGTTEYSAYEQRMQKLQATLEELKIAQAETAKLLAEAQERLEDARSNFRDGIGAGLKAAGQGFSELIKNEIWILEAEIKRQDELQAGIEAEVERLEKAQETAKNILGHLPQDISN